jgi:large subunit ribosomal protein L32e
MRLEAKGWPKPVKIGYGGPRAARGLHPSGYKEILIHTPDEVAQVKPNYQAIRIAKSVGTRKRIQIASLARERGVHVLNPLITRELAEETIEEDIERLSSEQKEAEKGAEQPPKGRSDEEELKADES